MTAIDAAQIPQTPTRLLSRSAAAWLLFAVWGALMISLGANGVFLSSPEKPPLTVLIAVASPVLIFLALHTGVGAVRDWTASLSLPDLIAIQSWRVVGFAFLAAWALGDLPAVFAFPAGVGDVLVGLAAPAVALAAMRQSRGWKRGAYALTAAGLADFIGAFATGILSREGALLNFDGAISSAHLGQLPFSLFPTFIVPAFLVVHVITIIRLRGA